MPPGFMSAICAPAPTVYASCASAITSPSELSPAGLAAGDVRGDLADDPVGDGRDRGAVLVRDHLGCGSTRAGFRT